VKRYRVGEKVRVPKGTVHLVMEVRTFRDELLVRDDGEARLFAEQVRAVWGPNFQRDYRRVLVQQGAVLRWYDGRELAVVESREEMGYEYQSRPAGTPAKD